MSNAALDALIWVLVYAGLLVAGLGLFVRRSEQALGWFFIVGGTALSAVGAVLLVVRSHRGDGPQR
jgi:vacuolar-type H+-ATPase subunit I/STV1